MRHTSFQAPAGMIMAKQGRSRRAFWTKQLHQWHWISSAICLVAMMLFSITGITLNHADAIPAKPETTRLAKPLPAELVAALDQTPGNQRAPLPAAVRDWLARELDLDIGTEEAEWSDGEIYLSLPRPGGDAWLNLDLAAGEAEYQRTDRGWIAYLNDLHKGRHTGTAWRWFIDVFAVASLLFCLTGLLLLQLHSRHRPSTWPVVIGGFLIPLFIAIALIH